MGCRTRYGLTALHLAAANRRTEAVELLLEWKADAAILDEALQSPLDVARSAGATESARLLREKNSPRTSA